MEFHKLCTKEHASCNIFPPKPLQGLKSLLHVIDMEGFSVLEELCKMSHEMQSS